MHKITQTEMVFMTLDAIKALEEKQTLLSGDKSRLAELNLVRRKTLLNKFPNLDSKVITLLSNLDNVCFDDFMNPSNCKTQERSLALAKELCGCGKKNIVLPKVINICDIIEEFYGVTIEQLFIKQKRANKGVGIAANAMFKSYVRVAMQHGMISRLDGLPFHAEFKEGTTFQTEQ